RNEDVVAKRQTALCFSVISRHFHPEQTRIEIARLRVIGYLHGNVVDVGGVGWGSCLSGGYGGRRRRGQRQGLNELTAGDLAAFEVLKQLADDVLHLLTSLLNGDFHLAARNRPDPTLYGPQLKPIFSYQDYRDSESA